MHSVVRIYSGKGAEELFDLLENRKAEVDQVMRPIQGFISYTLVRTVDGGFSVSVFEDKKGAEASMKAARDWIKANMPAGTTTNPPEIIDGTVITHLARA